MSAVLMTVFDIGDRVRLGNPALSSAEITAGVPDRQPFTALGVLTDPTAVTLTLLAPDRTETVWAWPTAGSGQSPLQRESLGRFYADYTWGQSGLHWARLAGTGAATAAVEFAAYVRPRQVP